MKDSKRIVEDALEFMGEGIPEGDHHKAWTLDQLVRILTDCPLVAKTFHAGTAREFTADVLGQNAEYNEFLREFADGEDGPHTYSWDIGIAP